MEYALFGKDKKYSDSQAEDLVEDKKVMESFDNGQLILPLL